MHIPDGFLGPRTCAAFFVVMAPIWYFAGRRLGSASDPARTALVSLLAAFMFVIMMFNVPVPGGTTGHMTGAVLSAIVAGPWAALLAASVTLALQALLFGDGGLLSLGANAFNLAFVACFSGYGVYSALTPTGRPGRVHAAVAAAIAAYVAVNLSALAAAIELGVQPMLEFDVSTGRPLYAPYPLSVTVPVVALAHLVFIGPIEAIGTALIVSVLHATSRGRLLISEGNCSGPGRLVWIALGALVLLTPLGLLAKGGAWGEWGLDEVERLVGYAPEGMSAFSGFWSGLLPDYGLSGEAGGVVRSVWYVVSAMVGTIAALICVYLASRLLARRGQSGAGR